MKTAWWRTLGLALPLLAGVPAALADGGPSPPCAGGGAPVPRWPAPGSPPAVEVWRPGELPEGWRLPACAGLEVSDGTVLVALAGSFRDPGGLRAALARVGAVSRQRSILAWDTAREAWGPMLEDAAALAGPDADARRRDFAPEEFRAGAKLHALYDDANPLGPVVYETLVRAADGTGFALITRNVVPGRLMGFAVAAPGDIESLVVVRREPSGGGDVLRYYALTAVRLAPVAAAMVPDAAHVSRAVATFRYVAGIRTDAEPPAAAGAG